MNALNQTNANPPILTVLLPHPNKENHILRNCCIKACWITGIVASFFLILAAYQVLPQGINAISSLGSVGYALSWGLLGTSILLALLQRCLNSSKINHLFPDHTQSTDNGALRNETSLALEPLAEYEESERFVTQDRYCFIISEYIDLLKNQFRFYNPYTQQILSDADTERLMENSEIRRCWEELIAQQEENETKISRTTLEALAKLAKGCLNKNEILQISHKPTPIAQTFLDEFACYYGTLDEEEKNALDNFWLSQDPLNDISASKPTKFGDLYRALDQSCVHTIGHQLILMVRQLDPNIDFSLDGAFANVTIQVLKQYFSDWKNQQVRS